MLIKRSEKSDTDNGGGENKGVAMVPAAAATFVSGLYAPRIANLGAVYPLMKLKDKYFRTDDLTDAESKQLFKNFGKRNIPVSRTAEPVESFFFGGLRPDIVENAKDKFSQRQLENVRKMLKEKGVPEELRTLTRNFVHGDKNSYVMAHELGHATSALRHANALKTVQALGKSPMRSAAIASARKIYRDEHGGDENRLLQAADYVGRAGTAAELAEEGQASIRALRQIHKLQGRAGVMKAIKPLGLAYGTYAGTALGTHGLAPVVASKLYGFMRPNREEEA